MEHEARFARLREGHLVRDTDPQGKRAPHGTGFALAAIFGFAWMAVVGVAVWLLG